MSRIMAFDYGLKRIGIAVSDSHQIIATGLDTISPEKIFGFLEKYLSGEQVTCFVVGQPRQMNNQPSEITPHVEGFVKRLKEKYPDVPVKRIDERFTSKLAQQAIIASGVKKKARRNKELVDQTSAVIILQSFMDRDGK